VKVDREGSEGGYAIEVKAVKEVHVAKEVKDRKQEGRKEGRKQGSKEGWNKRVRYR
jgi:hypothetical protein